MSLNINQNDENPYTVKNEGNESNNGRKYNINITETKVTSKLLFKEICPTLFIQNIVSSVYFGCDLYLK